MKKKFYQRKWFIILMCILGIGFIGSMSDSNESTSSNQTSQESHSSTTNINDETEQNTDITGDKFVEDVKGAIQGSISQKDEKITDVVLENTELLISVDLRQADPTPLSLEDLALSRTSSITDSILELTQYENLWNTITVDFGDLGKITNSKDNLTENEYGMRYFPSENFELK